MHLIELTVKNEEITDSISISTKVRFPSTNIDESESYILYVQSGNEYSVSSRYKDDLWTNLINNNHQQVFFDIVHWKIGNKHSFQHCYYERFESGSYSTHEIYNDELPENLPRIIELDINITEIQLAESIKTDSLPWYRDQQGDANLCEYTVFTEYIERE